MKHQLKLAYENLKQSSFPTLLNLVVALTSDINFVAANMPKRIKSISITRIIGSSKLNIVFITGTVLLFILSCSVASFLAFFLNNYFGRQILVYTLPFWANSLILI